MVVPGPSAASARRLSSLHCSTSYSTHGDGPTAHQAPLQQRHFRGRRCLTTSAVQQRPQQRLEQASSDRGVRRRGDAVVVAADAAGLAAMSTSIDMSRRGSTSCLAPAPLATPASSCRSPRAHWKAAAAASPLAQRSYDGPCDERLSCVVLHVRLFTHDAAQKALQAFISAC